MLDLLYVNLFDYLAHQAEATPAKTPDDAAAACATAAADRAACENAEQRR